LWTYLWRWNYLLLCLYSQKDCFNLKQNKLKVFIVSSNYIGVRFKVIKPYEVYKQYYQKQKIYMYVCKRDNCPIRLPSCFLPHLKEDNTSILYQWFMLYRLHSVVHWSRNLHIQIQHLTQSDLTIFCYKSTHKYRPKTISI